MTLFRTSILLSFLGLTALGPFHVSAMEEKEEGALARALNTSLPMETRRQAVTHGVYLWGTDADKMTLWCDGTWNPSLPRKGVVVVAPALKELLLAQALDLFSLVGECVIREVISDLASKKPEFWMPKLQEALDLYRSREGKMAEYQRVGRERHEIMQKAKSSKTAVFLPPY